MYRAIQNLSKLFFSIGVFVQISPNILNLLLDQNNDFKYCMHVGRVLKREGEKRSVAFFSHKYIFILNFILILRNDCFISFNFIWDYKINPLLVEIRWMEQDSGKIWKLSSKLVGNKFNSALFIHLKSIRNKV